MSVNLASNSHGNLDEQCKPLNEPEVKTLCDKAKEILMEESIVQEVPQKQKRTEAEKHPFRYASLTTITELHLNQEKKDLMKDSGFSSLLSVTCTRESSSSFLLKMLNCYDPVNKVFHFNEKTSFSFCTKEVASVLGMADSGIRFADYDNKCKKTAFDLKEKYPALKQNTIFKLKSTLSTMSVDDEKGKLEFKKLMTYFLLEGLLLPAGNSLKVPRVKNWGLVTNVEECWTVNWAEEICCHLHNSLEVCHNKHKNDPSKQHPFFGALFVLEAIVYERVVRLRPDLSGVDFPLVQKYAASRRSPENIDGILQALEPTDIEPCPHCTSGSQDSGSSSVVAENAQDAETVVAENAQDAETVVAEIANLSLAVDTPNPRPKKKPGKKSKPHGSPQRVRWSKRLLSK